MKNLEWVRNLFIDLEYRKMFKYIYQVPKNIDEFAMDEETEEKLEKLRNNNKESKQLNDWIIDMQDYKNRREIKEKNNINSTIIENNSRQNVKSNTIYNDEMGTFIESMCFRLFKFTLKIFFIPLVFISIPMITNNLTDMGINALISFGITLIGAIFIISILWAI